MAETTPRLGLKLLVKGLLKPWQLVNQNLAILDDVIPDIADVTALTEGILLKADINSPTLTGEPKAPTPASDNSSTIIATTAFVQNVIAAIVIADIPDLQETLDEKADLEYGYIKMSQIPVSLLGGLRFQSNWNANTNSPNISTLATTMADKGMYWIVSTAGATSLGGITDWQLGDHAVWSGTAWEKYDYSQITYTAANVTASDPTGMAGTVVQQVLDNLNTVLNGKANLTLSNLSNYETARTNLQLGDSAIKKTQAMIALNGATSPLVLSAGQYNTLNVFFTGTLSGNIIVEFPNIDSCWVVTDLTIRAGYSISIRKNGGSSITMYSGETVTFYATGP